ncbi:MAG: hypothetical protein HW380_2553 [Magnetococcales bacterium]|nr:hypothetical protein [Magnetococcales bacterium]
MDANAEPIETTREDVPQGYMKDPLGRLIPDQMVSELDRMRDQLVKEIVTRARAQSEALRATRTAIMADVSAFVELSAERWGAKLGGSKGNVSLTSYDGKFKVQLAISDRLAFSEGIHAAKALVDECITKWSTGSRNEIKVLVQDAFQVDKEGTVNTHRILSLLRLEIFDDTWNRAMEAIKESLITLGSKSYVRVYERDQTGRYTVIPMDATEKIDPGFGDPAKTQGGQPWMKERPTFCRSRSRR